VSERKYGELIITLKSDLCVGSGYSYAGVVDSDSCYDECGLPFIPAKRIKGCIREAVETTLYSLYSEDDVARAFGVSGDDHSSSFMLENAYIGDYDQIFEYLMEKHIAGRDKCPAYDAQEVLGRFSYIMGQTRMENGVAEKGSLRYTRSIKHFSPVNGEEMVFRAEFSCNTEDWDLISNGAKATRHIGLKRNRGLGNVRIETVEINDKRKTDDSLINEEMLNNGMVRLSFAIKNVQPLMLTKTMDDESQDYINGQQVLGLLAGRYLQTEGNGPEDQTFKDLFLNGSTIFSNLYPYDGKYTYYPAPDYIGRRKKTKKLVYTVKEYSLSKKSEPGDQPKKLKGKYVAETSDGLRILEVKKDVAYHHSHKNTHKTAEDKEEGILYSVEVLRSRQMFSGSVIVKDKYSSLVKELICRDDLYFGKSKIAQYGRCRLIKMDRQQKDQENGFKAAKDIIVTFLADAIFIDSKGNLTVQYDEVFETVKQALSIDTATESSGILSSLQTTTSTGYLSVWNLRRPAMPAIKAGSYLVFHLIDDMKKTPDFVGERVLEGYGQISVKDASELDCEEVKELSIGEMAVCGEQLDDSAKESINQIINPIIYDTWLERKIYQAINGADKIDVTNTAAGRFALMLRESLVEADKDYDLAFKKFGERIDSFKTGDTREKGRKILGKIGRTQGSEGWNIDLNCTFFESDKDLTEVLSMLGIQDDKAEKVRRWPKYVMAILTDRKYKGR